MILPSKRFILLLVFIILTLILTIVNTLVLVNIAEARIMDFAIETIIQEAVRVVEETENSVPPLDRTIPIYNIYKNGYLLDVPAELQWYIRDMANEYEFDEKIMIGLIVVESTFNPNATNSGCYGLTQIQKYWIHGANIEHFTDDFQQRNLLDPYDNILTCIEMMDYCRKTYNLDLTNPIHITKWLYWHNTGGDPSRISSYPYANEIMNYANHLELIN